MVMVLVVLLLFVFVIGVVYGVKVLPTLSIEALNPVS